MVLLSIKPIFTVPESPNKFVIIWNTMVFIAFITTVVLNRKQANRNNRERSRKKVNRSNQKLYDVNTRKEKPDGWTYNEENHEWVPQYLHNQNNASKIEENYFGEFDRFENLSDEEIIHVKQIQARRKEPTYEEWKAAKLKKQQEEQEHPED